MNYDRVEIVPKSGDVFDIEFYYEDELVQTYNNIPNNDAHQYADLVGSTFLPPSEPSDPSEPSFFEVFKLGLELMSGQIGVDSIPEHMVDHPILKGIIDKQKVESSILEEMSQTGQILEALLEGYMEESDTDE